MKKTAKTRDDLGAEFEKYFEGLRNSVLRYDDPLAPALDLKKGNSSAKKREGEKPEKK